jgi:plastocyanin
MGFCVVAAALVVGACAPDDGAASERELPATTAPVGVKGLPTAPEVDASGEPSSAVVCTPGGDALASVDVEGFAFVPGSARIDAGDGVTFTNLDATDHSVWSVTRVDGAPAWQSVGSDPAFRLPEVLHLGDASTCTFAAPGTYRYLCGVHNAMTGTIDVV